MEIYSKIGMIALLAAAFPGATLDPSVWAQWGLAGLVVSYTLYRDHNREKRMSTAIETDHRWVRETLVDALEQNTKALQRMANFQERDRK